MHRNFICTAVRTTYALTNWLCRHKHFLAAHTQHLQHQLKRYSSGARFSCQESIRIYMHILYVSFTHNYLDRTKLSLCSCPNREEFLCYAHTSKTIGLDQVCYHPTLPVRTHEKTKDNCTRTPLFSQGWYIDNTPNTNVQHLKMKMPPDTLFQFIPSQVCLHPLPEKQFATNTVGQLWSYLRKPSFHRRISQKDLYITLLCQNFT